MNSTKRQPSATGALLLKILQGTAVLATVKVLALAWLWTSPPAVDVAEETIPASTMVRHALTANPAQAADAPAPGDTAAKTETTNATAAAPQHQTAPTQDLLTRQAELDKREADLRILEQELDAKLENLKALERKMQKLIASAGTLQEDKMRHLVDVYSNMKPKQAAQVLETLEETIAVRILAGMSGRKAGEILSSVTPAKAAKLSEDLTKLQTGQNPD